MSEALQAAVFDMDGVLTQTAQLHAAAWKQVFDDFLRRRAGPGAVFQPFDAGEEYRLYVDGKPRLAGVRGFLGARGIEVPEDTAIELAQAKDARFERLMRAQGVKLFPSTVALLREMRGQGIKTAVVTSSRHGREILRLTNTADLFDACLDGISLAELGLKGKPDPDMFLEAAKRLGAAPGHALVVEDAVSGVQAGRRGEFGLVLGLDRGGNAQGLKRGGADLVLPDLQGVTLQQLQDAWRQRVEEQTWHIEQEGYDRARERQMESLFATGNGYMGVRGSLDTPVAGSQDDFFIAGVYDRKLPDQPYSQMEFLPGDGEGDLYAQLVPLPFPFRLSFCIAGTPLDFAGPCARELRRVLDLRQGLLRTEAVYESPGGRRTTVRTRRCASLADPHLLLQEAIAVPENHWSEVSVSDTLVAPDLATRHPHLQLILHEREGEGGGELETVVYRTHASGIVICLVARAVREANRLLRTVSVFTSRDVDDPKAAAHKHAQALDPVHLPELCAAHAAQWQDYWGRADIRVPGRPVVEQALRFGSYHLRLPLADDERVSIGARTLTGRAYEGHVFWDTEIFMLPFYLHVEPQRARNLLMYRYHTLAGACERARGLGYRGACYAWESTVTGADVTPSKIVVKSAGKEIPVFTGTQQVHVTADIAWAVWRYYEATGDEAFLMGPGARVLFETARFWASRLTREGARCHIRAVVGPDEYHYNVSDNAYTNWMVRFNLERAAWLAGQSGARPGASPQEGDEWAGLARALYVPEPGADGVIEQFEGFFKLADYATPRGERSGRPVSRLLDFEQINRVKLIKQADVLMLPMLFPEAFSDEVLAANYRYYEPLTDHGSSLSPAVHALVAARLGLSEDALRYGRQALTLDLSDAMDNSMLGVHPAAMGGAWQALVSGFLGIRFDANGPRVDPRAAQRLPPGWEGVELSLLWRGNSYPVKLAPAPYGEQHKDPRQQPTQEPNQEPRQAPSPAPHKEFQP